MSVAGLVLGSLISPLTSGLQDPVQRFKTTRRKPISWFSPYIYSLEPLTMYRFISRMCLFMCVYFMCVIKALLFVINISSLIIYSKEPLHFYGAALLP
ncbi:hypothetical protein XELAEV_18032427mg, partial [Xenopus laevis]